MVLGGWGYDRLMNFNSLLLFLCRDKNSSPNLCVKFLFFVVV